MVREQLLQLVFILHAIFLSRILACAPTPPRCVQPPNTAALIFNTADVQQNDATLGYNNTIPGQTGVSVGQCACTSGATQYYYTGSTSTDWNTYLDATNPLIMMLDCGGSGVVNATSMCVCVSDTECYTRGAVGMSVALAPVCIGGVCDVYMLVQGRAGTQMDRFGGGGPPITVNGQLVGNNFMPLPGLYPRIRSISCNGCPTQVPTTCIAA